MAISINKIKSTIPYIELLVFAILIRGLNTYVKIEDKINKIKDNCKVLKLILIDAKTEKTESQITATLHHPEYILYL